MTYLAIDYGSKHIGLAVGKTPLMAIDILPPLRIHKDNRQFTQVSEIIEKWKVDLVVIGNPLTYKELENNHLQVKHEVADFADKIRNQNNSIPIEFQQELKSTKISNQGLPPKTKRELGHSYAAKFILEQYFKNSLEN